MQQAEDDPRYKELENKLLTNGLKNDEFQELRLLEENTSLSKIKTSNEFSKKVDSVIQLESQIRLKNLQEPSYFSITQQKGKTKIDGMFDNNGRKVFIYNNPNKKNNNNITTDVHELTHKSTIGNKNIGLHKRMNLSSVAVESVNKNEESFYEKYNEKGFDYLANPTEIDAKQNSTRFYLYKKYPGYKAETVFTKEHFLFLKSHYEELPYDIQQLLDLFPDEDVFVKNMNTF